MSKDRDWSSVVLGIIVIIVVVAFGAYALRLLTTPDDHWRVQVTDKQIIPQGASSSDLVVTAIMDGRKQIFLARNSVVFTAISVGDTCDFTTYQGSQSIIVIRDAQCAGGAR